MPAQEAAEDQTGDPGKAFGSVGTVNFSGVTSSTQPQAHLEHTCPMTAGREQKTVTGDHETLIQDQWQAERSPALPWCWHSHAPLAHVS